MIKEQGIVIATELESESGSDAQKIRVRVDRKGACEACQMKSACGQKLLNESSARRCIEFDVVNDIHAEPGDQVTIAIPEKSFLGASLMMYMLPLLGMIIMAVFSEKALGLGDLETFLFAVLGFTLGLFIVRIFSNKNAANPDYQPTLVKPVSHQDLVHEVSPEKQ